MFRQALLLVCFIALATSASAWIGVGSRVEGDRNLFNQTTQTLETENPTAHEINMLFFGGENTFTYARIEIEPEWHLLYIEGVENGFNVTVGTYNTTQLFGHATIYGFPPGEAPIDFVPTKINSRRVTRN